MYKNKKILCLITARGGSKGLPGKNIKLINGKPLLAWPIIAAKGSKYVDKVVLSTDSKEIADTGKSFGAEVPFMRPDELSGDKVSSIPVIIHAIEFVEQTDSFDFLLLLEPTSPLTTSQDIDKAIELLINQQTAKSIVGVAKAECAHPSFMLIIKNGLLVPYADEIKHQARQDIMDVYYLDGSLYLSEINTFKDKKTFYHDQTMAKVMKKYKNIEIDDIYDFIIAEAIFKAMEDPKYERYFTLE